MSTSRMQNLILLFIFFHASIFGNVAQSNQSNGKENLFENLVLVDVEEDAAVGNLLQELDRPRTVMTMTLNSLGQTTNDCPLHLCNHINAIVLVPDRPRLFVTCLEHRQFCGVCPRGTVPQFNGQTFRCVASMEDFANDTQICPILRLCKYDFRQRIRVAPDNSSRRFAVCSTKKSFCGFCPSDATIFNASTLTCDAMFPETKVLCKPQATEIIPDPLAPCSPLSYICLPGKRVGTPVRCPNPKMRHNRHYVTCDLPEHVPECGGQLQPNSQINATEVEYFLNSTEYSELARMAARNCIQYCMARTLRRMNACLRHCTP